MFPRFGIPHEIHTDQGRTFISKALKHFYKAFGIQGTTTTRYRPTENSMRKGVIDIVGRIIVKTRVTIPVGKPARRETENVEKQHAEQNTSQINILV